jgi:hypothetical protein
MSAQQIRSSADLLDAYWLMYVTYNECHGCPQKLLIHIIDDYGDLRIILVGRVLLI